MKYMFLENINIHSSKESVNPNWIITIGEIKYGWGGGGMYAPPNTALDPDCFMSEFVSINR